MFSIGNVNFLIQLLIGQTILLYPCPKRKHFLLKWIGSCVICIVLAYFFPMYSFQKRSFKEMYNLLRFFIIVFYTIVMAIVCYRLTWRTSFSLCVAGYAMQHVSYQISVLAAQVSFLQVFNIPIFKVTSVLEWMILVITYFIFWFIFGRKIAKNGYYTNSDVRFDILAVAIIFICVVLTRISYMLSGFNALAPRIYAIVCCLLALIIQFILYDMISEKYEKEMLAKLWREDRKQYQFSKQMIDTINIKCHDLKYKLRGHKEKLSEEERTLLENTINIYDGMVKTGNEVLDVILSENYLQCQASNIKFTFMGNGEDLSFLSASDMYSLFGNALDNAREATANLKEKQRIINLTVTKKGEFINIDLLNYFSGEIIYVNDVILTSKTQEEGYHGFGIKSMQMIAKKYGGDVRISIKDNLFNLGIYLLIESQAKEE